MGMDTGTAALKKLERPVCSVCVANYNGNSVLESCLDSVFQQDFPYPIEVIVHDDASTDNSIDIVSEKFPSVRLIKSNKNVGFCISNNRMVATAKGSFVLLLNNDATLHKDALSTLYDYAVKKDIYGIIGLPQYDMNTGKLLDLGSVFDPFLNPIPNQSISLRNVGMVIGACMWIPKKLWDELGGFPEWFASLAEDMYLCCLARLKGYPVIALPKSGFNHWVGRSLGGGKVVQSKLETTYRRRALSERNKSYVMLLCYPGLIGYVLISVHFLIFLVEGLTLSVLKKNHHIWFNIYVACFKALWCKRQQILQLRGKIQAGKKVSSKSFYSVHTLIPHKLRMLFKYGLPTVK
jgi:GT2 family glycosyltransferase